MAERLGLLTVHAHPDDEASKGAGTVARYSAEGAHTVLVCCTGGEEGEVLNPAMNRPEVRDDLAAVRANELKAATEAIGYDQVVMLGYRDSGMADSDANTHPDAFAFAPMEEAIERLVAVIRRERTQVIVTYSDDQQGYQHPDHLKVHDISVPAFERAGDPAWYPEAGEPFAPSKLYYVVWSRSRLIARHESFLSHGLESPYSDEWFERPSHDDRITTKVPLGPHADVRRLALLAHATQVDPDSHFWFGLPPEIESEIYPYDDYVLARSTVETTTPEHDLFAGLRDHQPTT